jgi:hypothetical protein
MGKASWERDPAACGTTIDPEEASKILSAHRWRDRQYRKRLKRRLLPP